MLVRSDVLICPYFRIVSKLEKDRFSKCFRYQFFCIKKPKTIFLRYLYNQNPYEKRVQLIRNDIIQFCKYNCPKIQKEVLNV